ncbi:hypothetical protein GCM10027199_79890 [Amycolatopsis magusensis]
MRDPCHIRPGPGAAADGVPGRAGGPRAAGATGAVRRAAHPGGSAGTYDRYTGMEAPARPGCGCSPLNAPCP